MSLPCPEIRRWGSAKKRGFATAAFSLALLVLLVPFLSSCARKGHAKPVRQLRVCADPNNLPFSNQRLEGFENKIAGLIAQELNATVEYTWWAQRRGFIRNTLKAGACDVVLGVPSSFELALTTSPYYRSTYVFVYRKDKRLKIRSFDDPILRQVKIGVQMIGDDFANTPPAHALANRKIIQNVRGYTLYGDYAQQNPPARIVDAVAAGEVDVAIVWGPLAGYFAKRQPVPLEIVPVSPQVDLPFLPFVYDISMGVRRGDERLKEELEQILEQKRPEIERILDDYNIPRVDERVQRAAR
jgi:mxaJ protein